jgi:Ca2+-dependent lipid-binding protein
MPVWDIAPKEPEEFEVRVVIWDASDVKMMDAEDTTDAFVRCFFESRNAMETDTHYRLQPGDMASWNYRLCFRVKHKPDRDDRHMLTIQCYDRDWFKKNDLVGSKQIDLSNFFEDCSITNRPMQMNEKYV